MKLLEGVWPMFLYLVLTSVFIGSIAGLLLRLYRPIFLKRLNIFLAALSLLFGSVRIIFYYENQVFELMAIDMAMSISASIVLVGNLKGNLRGLGLIFAYTVLPLLPRILIEKPLYNPSLHYAFLHYAFYFSIAIPALLYWIVDLVRKRSRINSSIWGKYT